MSAHATSPWGMEHAGVRGPAHAQPAVKITWLRGAHSVTIAPFKGQQAACAAWLSQHLGLAWPDAGRISSKGDVAAAWNSPGDIMLIDATASLSVEELTAALAGKAAIVDQSSGRIAVRIAGEKAHNALMKLVEIDLHSSVLKAGMGGIRRCITCRWVFLKSLTHRSSGFMQRAPMRRMFGTALPKRVRNIVSK